MNYTVDDIKQISLNQLNPKHYDRVLNALNGLLKILPRKWIENEITYHYTDTNLIKLLGRDRMYTGICDLEKVVFLWEDLELIKNINGFDNLMRKLANRLRFENVDLEISIAADIMRSKAKVELEPLISNGNKKCDCRFSLNNGIDWIYVEITRKQNATTEKIIDERGSLLAKLVASINPDRRCVLVVKTEMSDDEYINLCEWLISKPKEGEFKDSAVFFSVQHNEDDTLEALKYAKTPISVRSGTNEPQGNSFGVVYLHIPDFGAENKLKDKQVQLPIDMQGVLFIDLTSITGGFEDWSKQIVFTENLEHVSAVVLLKDGISSSGYSREIKVIKNNKSNNLISELTLEFLENLASVRTNKNLMHE